VTLFLATFVYSVTAGVFPLLNVEIYLIAVAASAPSSALLPLIVAATAGQMVAKSLLYLTGFGLLHLPIRAAREHIERTADRLKTYRRGVWTLMLVSSFVGVPPFYVVSIAAGTLRLNFWLFFLIGTLGRLVRFAVVVLIPEAVRSTL
jgi:membrane protein YqaA with SNARE-associated domain